MNIYMDWNHSLPLLFFGNSYAVQTFDEQIHSSRLKNLRVAKEPIHDGDSLLNWKRSK